MKNSEVEKEHWNVQKSLNKLLKERGMLVLEEETYNFKAIGYLDITEPYEKGIVSQTFVNKLRQIWDTGMRLCSLGSHECEFCIDEGNYEGRARSSSEKTIIDKENNIKYIFPGMTFHYMEKHEFKPSNEFIKCVMNYNILNNTTKEISKMLENKWDEKVKVEVTGKPRVGMSSAGINISQVFDDELAKLTDKNITDICKNDK